MDVSNGIGANELSLGASFLSRPGSEFGNNEKIETLWSNTACEHAEIYFNLICSVDSKLLKLTPYDDKIYNEFRRLFPNLKVDVLEEENIRADSSKIKWRRFIDTCKYISNYNFGSLLRKDVRGEYVEQNTYIVLRIQFYAIEIARNREGLNNFHFINNVVR